MVYIIFLYTKQTISRSERLVGFKGRNLIESERDKLVGLCGLRVVGLVDLLSREFETVRRDVTNQFLYLERLR